MSTLVEVKKQVAIRTIRPMSPAVAEVRTNINLMVEVMKSCMVKDMHFGIIPGVQKPSLFKAGAEKLMATFRLSANPVVEDLSKDGEIRFRVKVEINAKDGSFVGAGIGECSSCEEKFMWRVAICDEEFEITAEDKRRIKFKKYQGKVEKINQVRCNPSDLANTILKMAKKRALVDGVLTATGASDLFSQDIEDLPAEYVHTVEKHMPKAEVIVPQEQVGISPEEFAQDSAETKKSIDNLAIGEELAEFEGLVQSVNVRHNQGKAKDKDITEYKVESASGDTFVISKWGSLKENSEGAICTFICVKRGNDFKENKQFICSEIIVKG